MCRPAPFPFRAICLALGLLGCGTDATGLATPRALEPGAAAPTAAEPAERVVLGTGAREYVALGEDAHATLIAGPQGAYHVWTSFLSYGFDTEVLRMQISTGWDDSPDVRLDMRGDVVARPVLDPEGVAARVTQGWPAVIRDPLCEDGRALRVNLSVTDQAGHSASDTRRWLLDVAEAYRPSDCDGAAP